MNIYTKVPPPAADYDVVSGKENANFIPSLQP